MIVFKCDIRTSKNCNYKIIMYNDVNVYDKLRFKIESHVVLVFGVWWLLVAWIPFVVYRDSMISASGKVSTGTDDKYDTLYSLPVVLTHISKKISKNRDIVLSFL